MNQLFLKNNKQKNIYIIIISRCSNQKKQFT